LLISNLPRASLAAIFSTRCEDDHAYFLDARSPCGALLSSEPTIQPAGNIGAHVRAPVQSTKMEDSSERRQKDASAVALTRGQVNAVRAAFKAGIKRSRIARQFGISQSDVRKVLASEFRESGRG
jgi:hypothetical protein